MHKKIALTVLTFLASIALAACSKSPDVTANATGTTIGDTIKVGVNLELTGTVAAYGNAENNGVKLAVQEINKAGGVDGKKIELITKDNKSENAEASPFSKCITIKRADILKYEDTTGFDTIISNPPFFVEDTLSPNMKRSLARHASSLHFEDLISKSIELMRPGASFQIILPTQNAKRFGDLCTLKKLSLVRRTDIITKKGGLPKRTMMHYINRINATMPVFSQLTINDENNGRTPEYTELTKDYYL